MRIIAVALLLVLLSGCASVPEEGWPAFEADVQRLKEVGPTGPSEAQVLRWIEALGDRVMKAAWGEGPTPKELLVAHWRQTTPVLIDYCERMVTEEFPGDLRSDVWFVKPSWDFRGYMTINVNSTVKGLLMQIYLNHRFPGFDWSEFDTSADPKRMFEHRERVEWKAHQQCSRWSFDDWRAWWDSLPSAGEREELQTGASEDPWGRDELPSSVADYCHTGERLLAECEYDRAEAQFRRGIDTLEALDPTDEARLRYMPLFSALLQKCIEDRAIWETRRVDRPMPKSNPKD